MAITAILIYLENGLLAYKITFKRCNLNSDLVAALVAAINQFGTEIFPDDPLVDILFAKTNLSIEVHDIGGVPVSFLVIHDVYEPHDGIYDIIEAIRDELRRNYVDAFKAPALNQDAFATLDGFIFKLFKKMKRKEDFACLETI